MWGLFRVEKDLVVVTGVEVVGANVTLKGLHQPSPANRGAPVAITVSPPPPFAAIAATLDSPRWSATLDYHADRDEAVTVRSSLGGTATVRVPKMVMSSVAGQRPPAKAGGAGQ
jgi:hypothetical protein